MNVAGIVPSRRPPSLSAARCTPRITYQGQVECTRSLPRRRVVAVAVRARTGRGSLKSDAAIVGQVMEHHVRNANQGPLPAVVMASLYQLFALDGGARALLLTPDVMLSLQKGRNGTMR